MEAESAAQLTRIDTLKGQIPTTKWFVGASFIAPMAGKYLLEGTQAGQKLVGHVVTYVPFVASKIKDIGIENFQWQAAVPLTIMAITYQYGTKVLSYVPGINSYMKNGNFKEDGDRFAFHAVAPVVVAGASTIGIRYAITWFTQSGDKWLPALAKDAKIAGVSALIGSVALIVYQTLQYARNGENRKLRAEMNELKEQITTNTTSIGTNTTAIEGLTEIQRRLGEAESKLQALTEGKTENNNTLGLLAGSLLTIKRDLAKLKPKLAGDDEEGEGLLNGGAYKALSEQIEGLEAKIQEAVEQRLTEHQNALTTSFVEYLDKKLNGDDGFEAKKLRPLSKQISALEEKLQTLTAKTGEDSKLAKETLAKLKEDIEATKTSIETAVDEVVKAAIEGISERLGKAEEGVKENNEFLGGEELNKSIEEAAKAALEKALEPIQGSITKLTASIGDVTDGTTLSSLKAEIEKINAAIKPEALSQRINESVKTQTQPLIDKMKQIEQATTPTGEEESKKKDTGKK